MKRFLSVFMGLLVTLFVFGKAESALVAYWPMDEGTGVVVEDVAGNYDGVIMPGSTVWTAGLPGMGSALLFNGTGNSFVDLTSDITLTGDFTISVWVKTTLAYWNPVISVYAPPTAVLGLKINTGVIGLYAVNNGVAVAEFGDYVNGVPSGEWTNVVVTASRTLDEKIYVNGEAVAIHVYLGYTTGNIPTFDSIVGDPSGAFGFFIGSMDEFKIYDTALTADEVADEYASALEDVANYYLGVCCDLSLDDFQTFYLPPGISRAQEDLSKNKNAIKVLGVIVP